jgi:hypothetical protein
MNVKATSIGSVLAVLVLSGCASLWPQTAELREALPAGLPERVAA